MAGSDGLDINRHQSLLLSIPTAWVQTWGSFPRPAECVTSGVVEQSLSNASSAGPTHCLDLAPVYLFSLPSLLLSSTQQIYNERPHWARPRLLGVKW